MKARQLAIVACIVCQPTTVRSDTILVPFWPIPTRFPPLQEGKSSIAALLGGLAARTSTTTAALVSSPSSTSTLSYSSSEPSTRTTTIDVSSLISAISSVPSTFRAIQTSASSIPSSTPLMSSSSSPSGNGSTSHRTLIIVLATVLGSVSLILAGTSLFLCTRYRKGQTPFGHRGASPINDDEIASWRRPSNEQKTHFSSPILATRQLSPIAMAHSPAWTWAASPSSIRTVSAHVFEPPAVFAQAPNARLGLTDEVVPGADPFITPPKRQNSRISKLPPGHARSKSRRSSFSGKSLWGGHDRTDSEIKVQEATSTWFAPDDATLNSNFRSTDQGSSSPGTSIFDGLTTGGLSPRPATRTRMWEHQIPREDIGRAIA